MLHDLTIGIKGAGEMASGVAHCLHQANLRKIFMMEAPAALAVRRFVSFCSAEMDGETTVEGVTATKAENVTDIYTAWGKKEIPVMVDPRWRMIRRLRPDVVVDAILAKKNLGTTRSEAPLVIGLGPGFVAAEDVHLVIETNRGHNLGRHIFFGPADANTGIPGTIGGFAAERVLRAPVAGIFASEKQIGDQVVPGEVVGTVGPQEMRAEISGVLRGLIPSGRQVPAGLKMGDIDPRGDPGYCHTISDKARAIGGSVLTAVLMRYHNCPNYVYAELSDFSE